MSTICVNDRDIKLMTFQRFSNNPTILGSSAALMFLSVGLIDRTIINDLSFMLRLPLHD